VAHIHSYCMVEGHEEAQILVQVEHVSVVSEICFAVSGMVLWDHKVISLEILNGVVEIRDDNCIGLIVMWISLKH